MTSHFWGALNFLALQIFFVLQIFGDKHFLTLKIDWDQEKKFKWKKV